MPALLPALLLLCRLSIAFPGAEEPATPNELLAAGPPTFVVGTAGDEKANRAMAGQALFVRDLLFPGAPILADAEVLGAGGVPVWPARPVVYGGPHVNALLAALAADLPFRLEPHRLEIGGEVFAGDDVRLIALVPAGPGDGTRAGHPAFLLYGGTATPGIAEINAIPHGGDPFLVADAFGPLVAGRWERGEDGRPRARIGRRLPRIPWREDAAGRARRIHRPALLPPRPEDAEGDRHVLAHLAELAPKLSIEAPVELELHLYPDRRSKESLTGRGGDAHAIVEARVVHALAAEPAVLARLLAHEATHVLLYHAWGPAGSPLLGEGLAVWAAGGYGGIALDEWRERIERPVPTALALLGPEFRQLPEARAYPLAGLLVAALVETVGMEKLARHLYGAAPSTWEAACAGAGTTPTAVEDAFHRACSAR
ncbi:MAG: hypothetical protein AB1726_16855 [Planctomycetota bacterium]